MRISWHESLANGSLPARLLLGVSLLGRERLSHVDGARVGNHTVSQRLITTVGLGCFNFANDAHSLQDLAKDNVTSVQPRCLLCLNVKIQQFSKKSVKLCNTLVVMKNWDPLVSLPVDATKGIKNLRIFSVLWTATCICHRQPSWAVVLQLEVFILETLSVDRPSTGSITLCEVST